MSYPKAVDEEGKTIKNKITLRPMLCLRCHKPLGTKYSMPAVKVDGGYIHSDHLAGGKQR